MLKTILNKIATIKSNKAILNGALFSLFSFINRGFSFVLLMILANFITPAEYGYLSLWGTVVMVIGYFISMSCDGYLSVSYFRDGESGISNSFSCIVYTTIIIGTILGILLVFKGESIGKILDLPVGSLFCALIISLFTVYANLNLDLFRIKEKIGRYGLFSCTIAILNFAISIWLIKCLQHGWLGRVYGQLITYVGFGMISIFFFIKGKYLVAPDFSFWKKMLLWGIPLIPHLATSFIRQGCDRYIINGVYTIEQVGLFSFALNLATIISVIGMGFNQSNSVDIYKVLGDKGMDNAQKLQHLNHQRRVIGFVYLFVAISVTIICYLGIPWLFPKYSECRGYIPLLSLYAFFVCLYFLYTNYLFFYEKTKTIMLITLSSALIHLGLSLLLTRYSLYLTCLVYCFTQFMVFILIRWLALKELKGHLLGLNNN